MDKRPPTCEWNDHCVGLDETPEGPVAVLGVRRGNRVTLEPAAGPVAGAALAMGLGERESWVRRIQTPLKDKAKGLGVLPGLLDVQLPFGIEECVFQCVGMRRQAPAGWALLAAVTRENDLQAYVARRASEGREPHHVDQEGLALWTQALEERPPETDERRAVVYLGEDRTVLAFGRGPDLISTHGLKRFEAAQAQRLARLAFEGGAEPNDWIWAGPLAEQPQRVEGLVRELNAAGRTKTLANPKAVLARAYARRALTPGPLRCDFRQDGRMHDEVRAMRERRDRFSAAVWLAAGLILLAAGLTWRGLVSGREARLDRAVRERTQSLVTRLGGPATVFPGYEQRAIASAWEAARDQLEPYSRALDPGISRGLGRLLMAAREDKIVFSRLEWTGAGLKAEGRAASEEAATRLSASLSRGLGTATVRTDPKAAGASDVHFVLEAGHDQ